MARNNHDEPDPGELLRQQVWQTTCLKQAKSAAIDVGDKFGRTVFDEGHYSDLSYFIADKTNYGQDDAVLDDYASDVGFAAWAITEEFMPKITNSHAYEVLQEQALLHALGVPEKRVKKVERLLSPYDIRQIPQLRKLVDDCPGFNLDEMQGLFEESARDALEETISEYAAGIIEEQLEEREMEREG